ncbi:MAG: hypothetical protein WCB96_01880 [Candidatus Aminicenantales bacterium]
MSRVAVQFAEGPEVVGRAVFFNAQKPTFPLEVQTEEGWILSRTIRLDEVKKILFLKPGAGAGSHLHRETIDQSTFASTLAFKLVVEFQDGEVVTGTAVKYSRQDKGFFVIPMNPGDRSERIYINARFVKNVDQKRLLGHYLLDQAKITHDQLQTALHRQEELRTKKIGAIMVERTMINQTQLDESLKKQKDRNIKLGEILIEAGYITREQLENALRIQKEYRNKRLGQILVDLKYLTPNDICLALASQLGCGWVDLSAASIPPEIFSCLPPEVVKKFEVVAVEKKGDHVLVVAASQPQDAEMRKELSRLTQWRFEFVIGYDGYILSIISHNLPDSS